LSAVVKDPGVTHVNQFGPSGALIEVFDAANNTLRVGIVGSGSTVVFRFDGPGPARVIEVQGVPFTRK